MIQSLYMAHPEWQILYKKAIGEIEDVKTAWIMHSPSYFGEFEFFESLRGTKIKNQLILTLDLDHLKDMETTGSGLQFAFNRLCKKFLTQSLSRTRFAISLVEFLKRVKVRLLIVLRGNNYPIDMAMLLDGLWLSKRHLNRRSDRLKIIALSDYRLLYYDRWQADKSGSSIREFFEILEIYRITKPDLRVYFSNLNIEITDETITGILSVTGGNFGLVAEVAKGIIDKKISLNSKQSIQKYLESSKTALKIQEYLLSNFEGKAGEVLKFKEKEMPIINPTPLEQGLQNAGVLYRDGLKMGVFPGLIMEIVIAIYEHLLIQKDLGSKSNVNEKISESSQKLLEGDFVIVHLSDIHLEEKFSFVVNSSNPSEYEFRRDIIEFLRVDLENQGLSNKIDALVMSGDFTNIATEVEFRQAKIFVDYLMSKIKVPKDKLIIAAGNHDISWEAEDVKNGLARNNYAKFRLDIEKGTDCLCEKMEFNSASGKNLLRIIVMDSNLVEGKAASGIGFISPRAFTLATELMQSDTSSYNHVFDVLVVHHHVFPVGSMAPSRAAHKDVSLIANASELIEFACKKRFRLILHGHEHKPCISHVSRWVGGQAKDVNKKVLCLGAGSFSAGLDQLAPYSKNHYYIIVIGKNGIEVRSRTLEHYSHSFTEEITHFFEH